MRIKTEKSEQTYVVYGIYWHENKTYFYYFPKSTMGLTACLQDAVQIVDADIGKSFQYVARTTLGSGIFHKYLIEDNLLDRLVDHDAEAFKQFFSLIERDSDDS